MQPRLIVMASLVGSIGCLALQPAAAQSLEDKLRTQLRATTLELRQAQDVQAQLQMDKSTAEQQRDKALADLKKAQADLLATQGKAHAESAAEHALTLEKDGRAQDQQQLAKYKSAYDELRTLTTAHDAERNQAQTQLQAQSVQLQSCTAKNQQLYRLGHDILQTYEHAGVGSFLWSREPFAQSARVKYDEIVQNYDAKLYAARLNPNAAGTGGSASGDAPQTTASPK